MNDNTAIAFIIPLIVKNNAGEVAIALRNAGYSKNFIKEGELEARLFQLYTANADKFFEVMKSISWNYGETETNKPEIRDALMKLTEQPGMEVSKTNWWQVLISLLAPGVPAQQVPPPPAPAKNTFAIIALALVGIGIIVALIFMIRSL